ncbi:MAG: BON domain-containing protein [Chloroflexota bacterium]|nr:BON domain-containing protein [Chloroflexota bacterium]
MGDRDVELERRVRGIIAVVLEDIDAVICEVEDGVAYIEGVVPSEDSRRTINKIVGGLDGLTHVVTCLTTETVIPSLTKEREGDTLLSAPVLMHYHSLS